MGPDDVMRLLSSEREQAQSTLLDFAPKAPRYVRYDQLWPLVLARQLVRRPDVNSIATRLRAEGKLSFPDWEKSKRVPQAHYRVQAT